MRAVAKGLALLMGSGRPGSSLFHALVERGLAHVHGRAPRVAVSLAPIANVPNVVGRFLGWFTGRAFRGAEVTRFTVEGEARAMPPDEARAIVAAADLVFVSGGDPVLGAELLARAGADAWIRDARARGASCMGGSAGAIVLGAYWARWPDQAPP